MNENQHPLDIPAFLRRPRDPVVEARLAAEAAEATAKRTTARYKTKTLD